MAIFWPKPSQIFFLGLVPKSPIHNGLIYVKNPKPNISCLGPSNVGTAGYKYIRTDLDVRFCHRFMVCFIVLEDVGVSYFWSKLFQFLFFKRIFFYFEFQGYSQEFSFTWIHLLIRRKGAANCFSVRLSVFCF
jgi:hypothetical protein